MTDVFQGYERQYCEISASLSRKCTTAASQEGEKLKQKASEIKSGIDGAEALIRKMDLEARNLQPSVRAGQLAKLREYKSDLNNLKGALKRITAGNGQQGAREELLESGMADTLVVSADQRSRLLRTTERQNQSTDRIRDSHRTMLETEELGVSIMHDLHQQRQSLLHANDTANHSTVMIQNLHDVDDNVGKSRKIMGAMVRRMDRNKWIIGLLIALLVLAILVVLYFKFVH
ncbi:vesicle transport v-SNARE 13-like [Triticum aestivum]|uniref:vesicle transport v-SNARE 13-like n=1 Tax=Triticum aestivum TaxID=4565 RepID=UPI001D031254|nr:vesicle transport v-SNARE 13-like [Triticum aestivum]